MKSSYIRLLVLEDILMNIIMPPFFVTFAQLSGVSLHLNLDLDPVASLGNAGLVVLASEKTKEALPWKITV